MLTLVAPNLHPTIDVHSLVATQVRELRIGLAADFAAKRLDARVDVLMLFEAARSGERLAAFTARVASGADVLRPDVALKVGGIGEDFLAAFANVTPRLVVRDLVSN